MKKVSLFSALLLTGMSLLASCGSDADDGTDAGNGGNKPTVEQVPTEPVVPQKTNSMQVFAHYMPWFAAPEESGVWNHWTMSTQALKSDKSNLASHFTPLTGAYSSSNPDILDYQCLLMKYSGIEGVMIDWYGTQNTNDYPANKTNTEAMVRAIEKAGMRFAIVYEDQTLNGLTEKVAQARLDLQYLATTMFKSKGYVKINDRPLLMCFGPQGLTAPSDWTKVFATLATKPVFVVLNGFSSRASDASNPNSSGEFLWVNPTPDYSVASAHEVYIGGAMPGFKDHYKESGQGTGYTTYDAEDGALFQRQLSAAQVAGLKWLQVSTWNDYGEGTIIEPTEEFGYRYLTALQQFTGISQKKPQLEAIFRWYGLKRKYASDSAKTKTLNNAYAYFNAMQPDKAIELMEGL